MLRAILAIALLLSSVSGASAQVRPYSRWQQIDTEHFRVVFEPGLEAMAQHAARVAETHYAKLEAELSTPPRGKIDIILGDNLDITNGAATPLPSNRILLWARAPVEDPALGYHNDWMDLVIAHELTHIFHMDRTGKVGRALRSVFGRLPWAWPIFPVIGTPDWTLEGLATYRESIHTGTGRVRGSYHEMVLRTSILENDFDPIDRVSAETPTWPGGQRAYIHGSMFMDYIAQRLTPQAHKEMLNRMAGSVLPPPWAMDRIAQKALGATFTDLYQQWQDSLRHHYRVLADSLRYQGFTSGERIAGGERQNYHPRISPDGSRLAFVQEDGRNTSSTVIIDLSTREATRTRRNGLGQVSWLNNATLATTQLEFADPYTIHSDLYLQVAGNQKRLTESARYDAVDADRDGNKLIVIKHNLGNTALVQRDAATGRERVIVDARRDQQWVSARWSPDGSRIAAERWQPGGAHDVVVLDTLGNVQLTIAGVQSLNTSPAWTPDGRFVVFASDRTGITNLYARDVTVNDPRLFEITNVLTGAFYPEISPDGQFIYYSGYHADGYTIERMRLDPATWRSLIDRPALQQSAAIIPSHSGERVRARRYSALRSALPKFWVPLVQYDSAHGLFLGAISAGNDDVDRHTWFAALGINVENARTIGDIDYTYAGLGNPLLTFRASREYDLLADISSQREDNVAVLATLLRPKWRTNLALTGGIEGVVIKRDTTQGILDPEDRLLGVVAGLSFGSYRSPAYSISPEDGARASVFARRRFDVDPVFNDDTYSELQGLLAGYKSVDAFGFAHHAIAARASGIYRSGLGIGPTDVGGSGDFLPVRGFSDGDRIGFTAWSASLEYRIPIAMIGRGYRLWPVFVDRVAGSVFVDAGNAACTDAQESVYAFCPGNEVGDDEMLISAGAEVFSNVAILTFSPAWMRAGIARPLQGPRSKLRAYFSFGRSF